LKIRIKLLVKITTVPACLIIFMALAQGRNGIPHLWKSKSAVDTPDTPITDTGRLRYPLRDRKHYELGGKRNPIDLKDPSNIQNKFELDSTGRSYRMTSKIGGRTNYRSPAAIDFDEYLKLEKEKSQREYFRERAKSQNVTKGNSLIPQIFLAPKAMDKIFGGGLIDIRPQGSAELTFGGNFNTVRNPAYTVKQQKTGQFDFKQKIQLNAVGKIGEKLKLNFNYDTEATFDFENQMKLDYSGDEDDIIKKIEVGNVSLPLNGTLIPGSQSLFGIKTQMQFGRMTMTTVLSQQKGKTSETEITGGAQTTTFDIQADNYDANRHYFLSNYFQQNYNSWMNTLPIVSSPVTVTRIEVWVTNTVNAFNDIRYIVAHMDLGERTPFNTGLTPTGTVQPSNNSNNLFDLVTNPANATTKANLRSKDRVIKELETNPAYQFLQPIRDYQITYARLLSPSEYTYNARLGYISLSNALNNDQILGVAFAYQINGDNQTYQVGEFSQDFLPNPNEPNVLHVKMLKGTNLNPQLPMWKLMMKNIYALNAFQVQQKDFKLNVVYADDPSGADLNYLPEPKEPEFAGKPLISVLGLDNANQQLEPTPDGVFDFIPDVTIYPTSGKIIFPEVEPFGQDLRDKFKTDPTRANYYAYDALYDSTKFVAQTQTQFNKFYLRGSYQGSSSSEISLNSINVQKGSVKVTSNGRPLTENVDYTVDYNMGKVRIINTGLLNSGETIKVTSENNSLFNIQQKTLIGSRFDYKISNDFLLGATVLHQYERPFNRKVNIGEEPIKNTVIGLDGTYKTDSRLMTRLIDKLPFLETKEVSTLQVSGEFAAIIPGVARALNKTGDEKTGGQSYIDNFEGSETPIDLRIGNNIWVLSSVPKYQPSLFPVSGSTNDLSVGFNRARLAWYTIDASVFYRDDPSVMPKHLTEDDLSNHDVREIRQEQVFPNKQIQLGLPTTLPTFDLAFDPTERGPYNYNAEGLDVNGRLNVNQPTRSWGGIMRKIETNDFEAANIDYIEIWLMDPFITNQNVNGNLYLNLGNISEDVLQDSRRSYENGLPKTAVKTGLDETPWGLVPEKQAVNNTFDNEPTARQFQDIGLDGLNDADERAHFDTVFLKKLADTYGTNSVVYQQALIDPSNDNYHYYRGTEYDSMAVSILDRYKRINDAQGNFPTNEQRIAEHIPGIPHRGIPEEYPLAFSTGPNDEDINRDNTVNELEEYFQYKIHMKKESMIVGQNFITDSITLPADLADGTKPNVTWYQLKIPIRSYTEKIGGIYDFRSIRFMRMFLTGFNEKIVLRFGQLQLIRADWRKYLFSLENPGEFVPIDPMDATKVIVSTVNLEENGTRTPIPYVLPPGIERTVNVGTTQLVAENEQSLSLKVVDLRDGDARAVFKTTKYDVRNYKKLRMFIHAENVAGQEPLDDGELTAFIRLGTDFTANYYEYEIPLKITQVQPNLSAEEIWIAANEINFEMEEFYKTKLLRDEQQGSSLLIPYTRVVDGKLVTVVGIPDLSAIKVIMLGIRNPNDDGNKASGEVWFNELRVQDFHNPGGWAANLRVVGKLADFGNFTMAGNRQTVGYGGIDKKLNERSRTDLTQYSFSTNLEMGKFFPLKYGITIPLFYSYGQSIIKPQFNPLNPDILLETSLGIIQDPEQREQVKLNSFDVTTNKSFSLNNIKKNRTNSKRTPKPYDVENWSFSYIFNEQDRHNQSLESYFLRTYKVQVAYGFQTKAAYFEPFKKLKAKTKYLDLIKDFNLGLYPNSFGVRVDVDRRYGEQLLRNNDKGFSLVFPTYDKNFTMTRVYDLQYNFTKSLKMDYFSTVNTRIDEHEGKIDSSHEYRQIQNNLLGLGRKTKFDQTVKFNYTVPLNKFPLTNWITLSGTYQANYSWVTKPPAAVDTLDAGHTIQNSRNTGLNSQFNLVSLYNKIPFLAKLNKPAPKKPDPKTQKLDTNAVKTKKPAPAPESNLKDVATAAVKILMSLKNVQVNYNVTEGIILPGFLYSPEMVGMDFNHMAPGLDFVLGSQDPNFAFDAGRRGFLTRNQYSPYNYTTSKTDNFTAKAFLEPIQDLKIDLNVSKTSASGHKSNLIHDQVSDEFREFGVMEFGSYSISYNFFNTAFDKSGTGLSAAYQQFEANRFVIAQRLQAEDPRSQGNDPLGKDFPTGYLQNSQDVLIPAFLAAYKGQNAGTAKAGLSAFPSMPNPNWRITYNGLSRLKFMKKIAKNVNMQHQYSSTYTMGGFVSNPNFDPNEVPQPGMNFQTKNVIQMISVTEKFSPLLSVDVTLINDMTMKVEVRKERSLMLNTKDLQLQEGKAAEMIFTLGYRTKELTLPIKMRGKKIYLENDINFRVDVSVRNSKGVIRKIDDTDPEPTPVQGTRIITIKPSIDYLVNEKINLKLFYNRVATKPVVTPPVPTAITNFGVTLRYTLQ
jgi:cell surface protein SprA